MDSMPVIVDGNAMYNANNHPAGNSDNSSAGVIPKRMKRFRTVSESAVKQPMIYEDSTHASTSSLKIAGNISNGTKPVNERRDGGARASFQLGLLNKEKDSELSPLSDHAEEDEQ